MIAQIPAALDSLLHAPGSELVLTGYLQRNGQPPEPIVRDRWGEWLWSFWQKEHLQKDERLGMRDKGSDPPPLFAAVPADDHPSTLILHPSSSSAPPAMVDREPVAQLSLF